MSLLDKDVTEDIARGIRTVHEAAKDGIETAARYVLGHVLV